MVTSLLDVTADTTRQRAWCNRCDGRQILLMLYVVVFAVAVVAATGAAAAAEAENRMFSRGGLKKFSRVAGYLFASKM